MATDSEMGAPEGLLSVFFIAGLLLGTCLSEQACVGDACFDQSIHQLKIERSKTDPTSGLKYKERSTDLVATIDVIGVCLPGVNPNVLADTFASCSNVKVKEEVCTVAKRGWLEEKEGKSVVNENALLATFKDLDGGEDAVRECLQIPEVYEYDEYYYYDYANYFDEYDDYEYLEESASENRQRRAADRKEKEIKRNSGGQTGKKTKKAKTKGKNGNSQKRNRNKKAARKAARRTRKQQQKAAARAAKKDENKKNKKAAKKAVKADRKAKKEANKESSNAEKESRKKALSKLGLKKMPSKSTLEKLSCVQEKITELLVRCAKSILSKTN